MNNDIKSGPLEDLERRWRRDQSPQLTLHLAEAHRQQGSVGDAIDVLRQGLEHHPDHLAARVALGRFLLADGQAQEAAAALQAVVDKDPTHLVANKLLVKTFMDLSDPRRARDRLDLYATLNPGDPEIEELELRVSGVAVPATGAKTAAPEKPAAVAPEESEGVDEIAPGEGYAEAAAEPAQAAHEAEGEATAADSPAPERAPAEEAEAPAAVPVPSASDPFPEVWRPLDVDAYRAAVEAEGLFSLPTPTPPPSVSSAAEVDLDTTATSTLGRLYLDQGHKREAEEVFHAVLAREPENLAARAGLRQAAAAVAELRAADLIAGEELAAVDAGGRKRLVLERYLERLKLGRGEG